MKYTILGFDAQGDYTPLQEADTEHEARSWVEGYTRHGDWGGYSNLNIYDKAHVCVAIFDAPTLEVFLSHNHLQNLDSGHWAAAQ